MSATDGGQMSHGKSPNAAIPKTRASRSKA